MKKILFLLIILQSNLSILHAQNLGIREIHHFFRPHLTGLGEWQADSQLKDLDSLSFGSNAIGFQASIPIKGRVGLDLNLGKLKNIFKVATKGLKGLFETIPLDVSAYQILWNVGGGVRNMDMSFDQDGHTAYYFTTGIEGVHIRPELGIIFYNANLSFSEEGATFNQLKTRFTGFIGRAKMNKLASINYYGLAIHYRNNKVLPVPFAGTSFSIPPVFHLQLILPYQAKLVYKKDKKIRVTLAATMSGFETGFENQHFFFEENVRDRLHLSATYLQATSTVQYKLSDKARLQMEIGTLLNQNITFWDGRQKVNSFDLNNAFFYGVRYEVGLGDKSLVGNLLRKLDVDL
ncbi:MAG: hypothetical protein R3E32_25895 [Chitinophagales bacterium]